MSTTSWKLKEPEVIEITASTPAEGLRALADILDGKADGKGQPIMPLSISTFMDAEQPEAYQFIVTLEE